ncbi:hypothetical protein [Sphingosinithalassobacter sp. LHW66-3]|uniref:hypothetical protein n=1 Tax=Sphingosinithalassobacter sp. LHW66-3 TaxID=3424718 RepID=UPI003D6AF8B6
MAETGGQAGLLQRIGLPPERLPEVSPRWRWPLRMLWGLLLLVALVSLAGGLWRSHVTATITDPSFATYGIYPYEPEPEDGVDARYVAVPLTEPVEAMGFVPGPVVAVDGAALSGEDPEAVARLLRTKTGPVRVTTRDAEGATHTFMLPRTPEALSEISDFGPSVDFLILNVPPALAAALLMVAAILLVRRRPDDPVSLLLSFSFLSLASVLPGEALWYWLGLETLDQGFSALFFGLFAVALPAFPDGRFRPRWGGWIAVAAVPVTVAVALPSIPDLLGLVLALGLGLAAALASIARFRRTPPGIERQQLKWVAFGFVSSMALLGTVLLLVEGMWLGVLPDVDALWFRMALLAAFNASLLLMAGGVLVAMLRYRLWDADAAIGRSIGYAAITLVIGGIWAASMTILNEFLAGTLGANRPLVAAVSAVIAAMVLGPARERVNNWVEKRFQAGVLALRKLPERLQLWQHDDHPEDLGGRVVHAVIEGLHARQVAVLLYTEAGYRIVGAEGATDRDVAEWMDAHGGTQALAVDNLNRRDPVFPLRITLDDEGRPIGVLLLGPRSDGNIYSKDERKALEAIENALAAALRQAQLRRKRDLRTQELIRTLETRLSELERGAVGAGSGA